MIRRVMTAVAALSLSATLAACGSSTPDNGNGNGDSGDQTPSTSQDLPQLDGASIEVAAVWTGEEQKTFEKVIDEFEQKTGAKVQFTSTGDQIATVLGTRVKGGDAPDIGILPQPGLMDQFAQQGVLTELPDDVQQAVGENYSGIWKGLGSVDGTPYGVWVDAANKSTFWYNTEQFQQAGITDPPASVDDLVTTATTLSDAGVSAPVSIGGADGWVLTDWFENVYLRQAGAEKYDQLAKHEIPWTDDSVVQALTTLSTIFGDTKVIGDPGKALQTDFPTSVTNTFKDSPDSAMVYEGSFAAGVITSSTKATIGEQADWFPFPTIGDSPEAVVGSGDVAVAFNDDEATLAFLRFLATPDAAAQLVSTGSFTSANSSLDPSAYPDENSRKVGQAIVDAGDNFRFDMSDLAPSAFGGTKGSGEWKILQDFLRDPSDPQATAQELEKSAAKAYKS